MVKATIYASILGQKLRKSQEKAMNNKENIVRLDRSLCANIAFACYLFSCFSLSKKGPHGQRAAAARKN